MSIGEPVYRRHTGERLGVLTAIDREFCFAGQHWWHREAIASDRTKLKRRQDVKRIQPDADA